MTEDDTFETLRRKPLKQVFDEFRNGGNGTGTIALYTFLKINGWTLNDYLQIYYDIVLSDWISKPKAMWVSEHMKRSLEELKDFYGDKFEF